MSKKRPRTARREIDRAEEKLAEARTKLARLEPGGSPARPIRVYIPFTAGSAADIIMRALEPQMREKLGQSFIIDNRGGAGGSSTRASRIAILTLAGTKIVGGPGRRSLASDPRAASACKSLKRLSHSPSPSFPTPPSCPSRPSSRCIVGLPCGVI